VAVSKSKGIAKIRKKIVHVSDANPQCKVLVYGRSGHGKTRFAASGPKTIILDVNEKGTRSVRSYNAHMIPIDSWEELTFAYWMLKEGSHKFETVVIDTLTQVQYLCMRHVLREAEDRDPNRPASMPRRQDWGQLGELMKPLILNFRNLPMNVVFVCQERVDKSADEDEEVTNRRVPDLSPSVRGIAMASVEVMGRIYKRKVRSVGKDKTGKKKEKATWQTRMLVGPHEDYETKDRTGALGTIIIEPTMEMVIRASLDIEEEE
jgi:phage nucleotide-binding protein